MRGRNQHPLPAKPGGGRGRAPAQNSPASSYGFANNAAGGYGGYGSAGYNAAGGYPGYAYGAAGGYPSYPYNAAGGYPGYGASGGYPYAAPAQAWRNCAHPGCSHAGPGDQMAAHEASHSAGGPSRVGKVDWSAFAPAPAGQRSEEEEAALRRLGGGRGKAPMIQGTGIRLETPEDIQKWIAERKRKFPTRERAQEKAEEEAEAVARGEDPRKRRRMDPALAAEEWGREPREPVERAENTRGRGRGRGRGAERGRGRGRGGRAGETTARPSSSGSDSSDTSSDSSDSSDSDSDAGSEPPVKPEDAGIEEDAEEAEAEKAEEKKPAEPAKPVCKFFARTGKCKHGAKCRFAHVRPGAKPDAPSEKPAKGPPKPPPPRQPAQKKPNIFARGSMLGSLLEVPIENTLSQLTQTIRFLAANDFLQGVERYAGEADEREREKNKITVVGEGTEKSTEAETEVKKAEEVEGVTAPETAETAVEQ